MINSLIHAHLLYISRKLVIALRCLQSDTENNNMQSE